MDSLKINGKIISISGQKQVGKDTVGNMIQELNPSFQKIAFADEVKGICSKMFNIQKCAFYKDCKDHIPHKITVNDRYNASEILIGYLNQFMHLSKEQMNWIFETMNHLPDPSLRTILQFVGTDIVRSLNPNFWIDRVLDKIQEGDWIITDARFKNERDSIKEMHGQKWLIIGHSSPDPHLSENSLQDDYDVVIRNFGDLDSLKEQVSKCLRR